VHRPGGQGGVYLLVTVFHGLYASKFAQGDIADALERMARLISTCTDFCTGRKASEVRTLALGDWNAGRHAGDVRRENGTVDAAGDAILTAALNDLGLRDEPTLHAAAAPGQGTHTYCSVEHPGFTARYDALYADEPFLSRAPLTAAASFRPEDLNLTSDHYLCAWEFNTVPLMGRVWPAETYVHQPDVKPFPAKPDLTSDPECATLRGLWDSRTAAYARITDEMGQQLRERTAALSGAWRELQVADPDELQRKADELQEALTRLVAKAWKAAHGAAAAQARKRMRHDLDEPIKRAGATICEVEAALASMRHLLPRPTVEPKCIAERGWTTAGAFDGDRRKWTAEVRAGLAPVSRCLTCLTLVLRVLR